MIRLITIFIITSITILLYSLTSWFENQKMHIDEFNNKYIRDIKKLEQIPSLNLTLQKKVIPRLYRIPKSVDKADQKLIRFFDKYSQKYNFTVSKYLYQTGTTRRLEIKYTIPRSNKKELKDFLKLKLEDGFVKFESFNVIQDELKGNIILIQPFFEGNTNVFKQ